MIKYLLDTNICIYIIKRKPEQVFKKFRSLALGDVAISSITLAEMQYGIAKSSKQTKNQEALDQFLLPLEILDFTSSAAIEYGKIRSTLASKGTPIGSMDLLIAAHARSIGAVLVTNNTREFKRVDNIKVENWVKD
ncbi:MAG: type II toxin-antitoxin system VapC family toxin [Gracilimonas sp.]|nr:type II toxin-antitoxin system VapC family toxin [Gracilimonas sp.]